MDYRSTFIMNITVNIPATVWIRWKRNHGDGYLFGKMSMIKTKVTDHIRSQDFAPQIRYCQKDEKHTSQATNRKPFSGNEKPLLRILIGCMNCTSIGHKLFIAYLFICPVHHPYHLNSQLVYTRIFTNYGPIWTLISCLDTSFRYLYSKSLTNTATSNSFNRKARTQTASGN